MRAPIRSALLAVPAVLVLCCGCSGVPAADPVVLASATTRSAPSASDMTPTVPVTSRPVPSAAAPPVVVLDPGHNGGNAAGAISRPVPDGRGGTKPCNTTGTSSNAGYPEHAFAWDLAQRVRSKLEASGIRVVLTRKDDRGVGPCVDQRGAAGGKAGAAAMVSLHADGATANARGFHIAYAAPPVHGTGPTSVRLATALRDGLRHDRFPTAGYIGKDGLDGRKDLAGLNLSTVPTALVEAGNMRNAADAAQLSSAKGRDRYATAISRGILAFLGR